MEDSKNLKISNKQLTYLPGLPANLESLDCSINKLTVLPELPKNLKILECHHNNLKTLPKLPDTLEKLHCTFNSLMGFLGLPENLKILYCSENRIIILPKLPGGLEELYCENNKLSSLPKLSESLSELYCSNNKLTVLPELPKNLKILICDSNKLTRLPELPKDLEELSYEDNELTTVPELPDGLKKLFCDHSHLRILPELPDGLTYLSCRKNNLTSLPNLPKDLGDLYCNHNDLTSLPNLPEGLTLLVCDHNNVTSLPNLPEGLADLYCNNNNLTSLPELPDTLMALYCNDNKLSSLPKLPEGLMVLYCNDNNLTSLPKLPEGLVDLYCNDNNLTSLPELPDSLREFSCKGNPLKEPYKSFVEEYEERGTLEKLIEEVNKYNKGEGDLWKGFTRSDIGKLDSIFEEDAEHYSLCPVCLKYVERSEACNYVKHICAKDKAYYHEELYNKYKTSDGYITWCTICGRIAKGHNHYKLENVDQKNPEILALNSDPFEKDCRKTSGGGGLPEKLARFRRFREYALELQDDIDKKGKKTALDELTEEVWNAPLRREKKILKQIKESKKWNISNSNFPKNVASENNNTNAPNIPFAGKPPTKVESGRNNLMMNENIPVLRFHHTQKDGSEESHGIAEESLIDFIQDKNTYFGKDDFGYCFMYPGCDSKLHPEEIKGHVPDEMYEEYKKKFNRTFKGQQGGSNENILQEATDAVCVIVKKSKEQEGGRRTRKHKMKGTRKHKMKRPQNKRKTIRKKHL